MKPLPLIRLLTLALALAALGPTAAWSEDPSHADHIMVLPADLKWDDAKALPPGAKTAVIEGPLNEAVPFTFRVKLPADYKIPAHWHAAIEHVTVLSGTYNFGTGDKFDKEKTKALPPGSTVIIPTQDQSLRLDWRGNRNPGSWCRPVGYQLRESSGRSEENSAAGRGKNRKETRRAVAKGQKGQVKRFSGQAPPLTCRSRFAAPNGEPLSSSISDPQEPGCCPQNDLGRGFF